jgi:hypothetical protein
MPSLPFYVSQGTFLNQVALPGGNTVNNSELDGKRLTRNKRAREEENDDDDGEGNSQNGAMVEVSEDEEDRDRRRQDRNYREQQRSQRITHQIDQLRLVLSEAQIRHKPDKFSTLITVGEYIKQLQERSAMLDAEHKKLIDTITKTNELANESHLPIATSNSKILSANTGPDKSHATTSSLIKASDNIYNEDESLFVHNVDYKSIFIRCCVPLAVTSIDGRLLNCNI